MGVLQVVCQGDVQLLLRHRLECTVLRSWSTKEKNDCAPETHLVLNDVTIHRGAWASASRNLCNRDPENSPEYSASSIYAGTTIYAWAPGMRCSSHVDTSVCTMINSHWCLCALPNMSSALIDAFALHLDRPHERRSECQLSLIHISEPTRPY